MKKIISLILSVCLSACLFVGCSEATENPPLKDIPAKVGTVIVKLDPEAAPITVDNFVTLAKSGFYDGLTFHRIIKDFMMQGGDPQGTGGGGASTNIKGEFSANGVDNPLSHTRGTISMARNGYSMDSASSQFFIVHKDSFYLDGKYAAFGHVTEGMDIVDKICEEALNTDDNGSVPDGRRPFIKTMKIVEEKGEIYAHIEIDYTDL